MTAPTRPGCAIASTVRRSISTRNPASMIEPRGPRRYAVGLLVVAAATSGVACFTGRVVPVESRWSAELAPLRIEGDTGNTDTIAPGALHRSFLVRQGPWAIHVLDIDRAACWSPIAVKGATGAVGRTKTSELI